MTSRTPDQIVSDMLAKMAVVEPNLDTSVGSLMRKMFEVVAEEMSEIKVDEAVVSTFLDLDTKSGQDLEDIVGFFNFGRLQGSYAGGSVTLTLSSVATQPISIPAGSIFNQVNTGVSFASTIAVNIDTGSTSVSVPVRAVVVGPTGNAAANTVKSMAAGNGVSSVTNSQAFTGGTADETDEQLRARFKKCILRNIAGTEDFYFGVCLQADGVSRVNVLGPTSVYETQAQVVTGSNNIPGKSIKYVWPKGFSVAENRNTSGEAWFTEGLEYAMTSGSISFPVMTAEASLNNKFLDISYEYTSTHSRNDPVSTKVNKIDIFVDGTFSTQVQESMVIKTITLNNTGGSDYNFNNFVRTDAGTLNTSSKFQILGSTPILTWPSQIAFPSISPSSDLGGTANPYLLGTHYVGVYSVTTDAGSEREIAGIVWTVTPPTDNLAFTATYTYNQIPQVLNSLFRRSKQITTDVLVHQAVAEAYRFNFIIQYNQGSAPASVNTAMVAALQSFASSLTFGSWIQFSDLLTVVRNVPGVDNARMAKVADGASYTAKKIVNGSAVGSDLTADFQLEDNVIPILYTPVDLTTMFIRRSFNSFGS